MRKTCRLNSADGVAVRIIMTLMVRDEVDVVGAMLEHHRAQGIDHVIVTDNASEDGTTDVLRRYERDGFVTLLHDPEHRKQQYQVVTRMARSAARDHGADWVINADADEFWVSSGDATVRDALARIDPAIPFLSVNVVNLTGEPARDGAGFRRLVYRDQRTEAELRAAGIPFHPTPDAVHRAHPEVEVAQGNHFVTAPGWGEGQDAATLEVLHLPWRSWRQYEGKVRKAGQAYEANPELFPSPRHHGMQDYRRWKAGRLEAIYVAKHPTRDEIATLSRTGSFVREERLEHLDALDQSDAAPDIRYDATVLEALHRRGRELAALEGENEARLEELRRDQQRERELWVAHDVHSSRTIDELREQVRTQRERIEFLDREVATHERARLEAEGRVAVRVANRIGAMRRWLRPRARS